MNRQMQAHIGLLYFVTKIENVYFDSFGAEHVPGEITEFVWNKNIQVTFFEYKQTIQ